MTTSPPSTVETKVVAKKTATSVSAEDPPASCPGSGGSSVVARLPKRMRGAPVTLVDLKKWIHRLHGAYKNLKSFPQVCVCFMVVSLCGCCEEDTQKRDPPRAMF